MQPHYTPSSNPIPETSGIYRIVNTLNGKFYIGSAVNLRIRRKNHFVTLRNNAHKNPYLQRAFNKHGEQAFTFEVIELVLVPFLIEREQHWFEKLQPFGQNGYNIASTAGSNFGIKYSLESIEKSRIARTGKKRTPETRALIGAKSIGRPNANRGKTPSDETRAKQSASHLGKKMSEETLNKKRKTLIVIDPNGNEHVIHGIGKFCREHNLHSSALLLVAKGKASHHKGWKARFPEQ